jgi:hypothetical protein
MGFFKKNDGYQLSSVLCLRVLGLNKENLKMVFHTGSNPVLTTRMFHPCQIIGMTDGKTSNWSGGGMVRRKAAVG